MQSNNYGSSSSSIYLSSVDSTTTTTDQLNEHLNLINVFADSDAGAGDIREIDDDEDDNDNDGGDSTAEYYHRNYCDSSSSTSANVGRSSLPSCNYSTTCPNPTPSANVPPHDVSKLTEIHPWMIESKNSKKKPGHKNANNNNHQQTSTNRILAIDKGE